MKKNIKRRELFKYASGIALGSLIPFKNLYSHNHRDNSMNGKILVVLELSGGNDGLNTIIPYADDSYYNHRPKIGIKEGISNFVYWYKHYICLHFLTIPVGPNN